MTDDGPRFVYEAEPIFPPPPPVEGLDRIRYEEKIALAFRVPYWLIGNRPRPSWLRRPVWRFRAAWWRRFT